MQIISIIGCLAEDCQLRKDRRGVEYIRFKVICLDKNLSGKEVATIYRCFTYNLQFSNLREGEGVFVSGQYCAGEFNGNPTHDITIQNLSRYGDIK